MLRSFYGSKKKFLSSSNVRSETFPFWKEKAKKKFQTSGEASESWKVHGEIAWKISTYIEYSVNVFNEKNFTSLDAFASFSMSFASSFPKRRRHGVLDERSKIATFQLQTTSERSELIWSLFTHFSQCRQKILPTPLTSIAFARVSSKFVFYVMCVLYFAQWKVLFMIFFGESFHFLAVKLEWAEGDHHFCIFCSLCFLWIFKHSFVFK